MNTRERHAWHTFRQMMATRQNEFDGTVPVALVCLPTCPGCARCRALPAREEGDVDVHIDAQPTTMWPPGMDWMQMVATLEGAAKVIRERHAGVLQPATPNTGGLLAREWASYRSTVVQEEAQLVECERAFYAGAASLTAVITERVSPSPETTAEDAALFQGIHDELAEFRRRVHEGRG